MRHLLALCLLGIVQVIGTNARAEDRRLQVTVEVPPQSEPTQLCVVSYFVPKPDPETKGANAANKLDYSPKFHARVKSACQWSEGGQGTCKSGEDVEQQLASNDFCAPVDPIKVPDGEYLWCEPKLNKAERVLAIHVDSGVKRANLTHSLVQLVLDTSSGIKKNTVTISTAGGDYLETAVASHRDPDGSDRASLPIVPRCARSHITIPRYECPKTAKHPVLTLVDKRRLSIAFDKLPDSLDLPLPQSLEQGGSLELRDCDDSLELKASWTGRPPAQIVLKPRVFPVSWRKDPLSAAICPDELSLPEVPLTCPLTNAAEQALAEPAEGRTCQYLCKSAGAVDLPTAVAFKEKRPAQTSGGDAPLYNHWESRLLQPGEKLEGYLRPEQRFITLTQGCWPEKREERLGDRITSIWIATPDGKEQYVAPSTPRLFVPGVSAGDNVTYRYMGDRLFDTQTAAVKSGGIVQLDNPDNHYTRGVQPGLAFWGGWRHLQGAKDAAEWNPAGGVELVLAVPKLRAYLSKGIFFEPEFHVGATVTTQSYESIFQATPSDPADDSSHNVLILLVPVEATLRWALGTDQLQWDVGFGMAWYRAFYAEDTNRLSPSIALSLPRASLLWRVTRGATLGFDMRLVWLTRRVIENFDFAGLAHREEPNTLMAMFGPILRFDDVF